MADAWILHAQEHLEASARQTALVKSAANTNTARANAERVQAAQEAKFCNSCNHPIYSCAWRVPSHARPGNLVRSGTKQPYWCACSAEDKARHFRTCKRRSEDPGPDSISVHWGFCTAAKIKLHILDDPFWRRPNSSEPEAFSQDEQLPGTRPQVASP